MFVPPIIAFDEIDSTNAEARRRAEAGEAGPLWITAALQTAGRGRRGRGWETPVGNLAATCLFVTDRTPAEAAQVSFVAALAVFDLARAIAPAATVALKWPNDLLVEGGKAAGILVESGPRVGGGLWLAVGIGVNLVYAPPPAPDMVSRPIAFLNVVRSPPTPDVAAPLLSQAFERWRSVWDRDGFAPIALAWTERAHGLHGPCTARLPGETVSGVAEGLDADGALRLRLENGAIRRITAGDVFFG